MSYEERESDIPDWEVPEEEIPEGLKEKWQRDEARGIKAGLCDSCGWPFTEDELSCRHCGAALDADSGAMSVYSKWLFGSPVGALILVGITAAVILFLTIL